MRVDPVFVRGHQRCAEPLAIFYFQTSYRLFVKKDKAARGIFDLSEFERSGCALLFSLGFFLRVIHRGAHSKNRVVVLRKPNSTSTTTQHTKPQTPKRKRPQLCAVASWSHLTQTRLHSTVHQSSNTSSAPSKDLSYISFLLQYLLE